jgi:signal-transduction protein with cAMP-binding, CBS, and nucleotidyltransferase domain
MAERSVAPKTLNSNTLRVAIKTLNLEFSGPLAPSATINEAVAAMQRGNFGAVLVAENGKLVGIFTERDLIKKIAGKRLDWAHTYIRDFMTPNPESLQDDANLAFALNMMTVGGYRHVPVVDATMKPIAVLSMRDVVRYLCSFFEKEVANLPPRPNLLHPEKREDG